MSVNSVRRLGLRKLVVLSASVLLSLAITGNDIAAAIRVIGRTARGNVLAAIESDGTKPVSVLIEVDARPGDRAAAVARAADRDRDLRRIDTQSRSTLTNRAHAAAESFAPRIGQVYTHVFQGVSAIILPSELSALRALPY